MMSASLVGKGLTPNFSGKIGHEPREPSAADCPLLYWTISALSPKPETVMDPALFSVTDVHLDPVTAELLDDDPRNGRKDQRITAAFCRELIASVQRDLVGERVYSSNAIEGNTYSLGETIEILRTGHIELGSKA